MTDSCRRSNRSRPTPLPRALTALLRARPILLLLAAVPAAAEPAPDRPTCALLPFENLTGRAGSRYLTDVIEQSLRPALLQAGIWRLVERARLEELIREEDFRAAGIVDGKLGPRLGADLFVLGGYRDEDGLVTVSMRLVDATTGEILRQADWSGHVSGLWDDMPRHASAALTGQKFPAAQTPQEINSDLTRACRKLRRGQVERAIEMCDRVLEDHPRHVPALLLRGYASLEKKGWTRYAVKDFENALALDPNNLSARLGLARAKLAGDRRTVLQALTWLADVLETCPDHGEALWLRALACEKLDQPNEAAEVARNATRSLPDFSPAWQALARTETTLGHHADALTAARRGVECDPQEPSAWMLLGDVNLALGDNEFAKQAFERALSCEPPPAMKEKLEARLRKFD